MESIGTQKVGHTDKNESSIVCSTYAKNYVENYKQVMGQAR